MLQRKRTLAGSLAVAAVLSLVPLSSGAVAGTYWQCVPFARLISGVEIFGDAWTWWRQAVGKYATGHSPQAGAVLCFKPTGKMRLGHVAVVSRVLTDRVVQVTHANWSRIGGTRGQIEKDVTVIDVSAAGDWSQVKVWYDPIRDLGTTTYPTHGFIYAGKATDPNIAAVKVANAQTAAYTVVHGAAHQLTAAVRPGANPLQMLGAAADSTDRIASLIQSATSQPQSTDQD
jgi:surface antigen